MPTVTVSLEGGGQLTVQTIDQTPVVELRNALQHIAVGQLFRVTYHDAEIIVLDGSKVLGGAVHL